jgi:hypothetical protein
MQIVVTVEEKQCRGDREYCSESRTVFGVLTENSEELSLRCYLI